MNPARFTIVSFQFKFLFSFKLFFFCLVFLLGSRTHSRLQQFSHFLITAEASSDATGTTISEASPKRVGRFQLFSDSLATFNENCVNTVSESDDFPKSEIQVMWVAPPKGSGCVLLSSMVYENARTWFADQGELKKIICEQKVDLEAIKKECCACDDAKYSVSTSKTPKKSQKTNQKKF